MPRVRLNHTCNAPGCVGTNGSVIDVSGKDATWLLKVGGAELVGGTIEAAEVKPTENAATRVGKPGPRHKQGRKP